MCCLWLERSHNLRNAVMTWFTIRPIVIAPRDQYSKLIELMTKETISAINIQEIMCNIIVRDLIHIILVCEAN
jgi:hypothetical protein